MNKHTALQRLNVIKELVEKLPEEVGIGSSRIDDNPIALHVYEYHPALGDSYETPRGVQKMMYSDEFFEVRYYPVGVTEIDGQQVPYGYETYVDVQIQVVNQ